MACETNPAEELCKLDRSAREESYARHLRVLAMVSEGLRTKPPGDRECRLSVRQGEEVKRWVAEGPDLERDGRDGRDGTVRWQVADIAARIKRKFGIQ